MDSSLLTLKPEFVAVKQIKKGHNELPAHQRFLQNFITVETPYNSLFLYHDLDVRHKMTTILKIIAEVTDYRKQMQLPLKKVYVVVKDRLNKLLQKHRANDDNNDVNNGDIAIFSHRNFGHKLAECIDADTVAATFSDAFLVLDELGYRFLDR